MTQKKLKLIFDQVKKNKKEIKIIKDMYKNCLENDPDYPKILEEFNTLKAKKKAIETRIENEMESDFNNMDDLKDEVKKHKTKLSDIALTAMINGEVIKYEDEFGNEFEPVFNAKFLRS